MGEWRMRGSRISCLPNCEYNPMCASRTIFAKVNAALNLFKHRLGILMKRYCDFANFHFAGFQRPRALLRCASESRMERLKWSYLWDLANSSAVNT